MLSCYFLNMKNMNMIPKVKVPLKEQSVVSFPISLIPPIHLLQVLSLLPLLLPSSYNSVPCLFLLHMQQSTVLASFLFPTSSLAHSFCFIRVYHFHTLFLQPCTIYPCFSLFTGWWWRRLVYFHSILKFSLIFSPSHSHLQTVHFLFALFSLDHCLAEMGTLGCAHF